MKTKVLCIIGVAAGLGLVLAATQAAEAQCGAKSIPSVQATAGPAACGANCTKPCCAAGPTGAKGRKACPPTCTKACCAGKPVAARTHLASALKQIEAAQRAIRAGDKQAALAALAKARQLVKLEGDAAAQKVVKTVAANATCPMSGRPINAAYVRPYQGKVVGFCGPGCAAAWDKAPDAKRATIAAKAAAAKAPAGPVGVYANTRCPMMGSKIDPKRLTANLTRTHNGKKVGFCCAGCPAAWDKLTDTQTAAKLAKAK